MLSENTLRSAVARLLYASKPDKIILFGSYACNQATEDSDLDLLVIEKEVADKGQEMLRLRNVIGPIGVGVDLLVYSRQEVEKRGDIPSSALYWALKEGIVLYDASSTA